VYFQKAIDVSRKNKNPRWKGLEPQALGFAGGSIAFLSLFQQIA
jgi:hypothetical protein